MRNRAPVIILLSLAAILGGAYLAVSGRAASLRGVFAGGGATTAATALAAPSTVSVSRGDVQQTVVAPGQLVAVDETVLTIGLAGRVAEIGVRPGNVVFQGDILARLDSSPFEIALEQALGQLARAEADHAERLVEAELAVEAAHLRLANAEAEHPRRVADAELALRAAEARLAQSELRVPSLVAAEVRLRNSRESEAVAATEYEEALERQRAQWEPEEIAEGYRRALEEARDRLLVAEAEYNITRNAQAAAGEERAALEAEVERARLALDGLAAGVDPLLSLELEKAHQTLASLREAGVDPSYGLAVRQARADLAATALTAPGDGVVQEVLVRPGESVVPGTELVTLTNPEAMEVRVTVIEEDLPLVQVGQPVDLFFDAAPEATLQGRVVRAVPQRVAGESRPLYHVYIAPEGHVQGLVPGMTADAAIIIDQRVAVLRLPRALAQALAVDTVLVEVWAGGRTEKREVRIGLRGDVYVEILGGLSENEQVVAQ
jgi:multidrug efflux pump subunit AcrA (membrane-fusion protein)